ncbi:class I SAM-dependent methyltransferase [Candidatus Peregrinibacteria bacterium]|nr:class I SAM-dependent methyltransferase [Candidatus Peregrinibacteria bacterium]
MKTATKTVLKSFLPRRVRTFLKTGFYSFLDAVDLIRGADPMIPPRRFYYIGSGDFKKIGEDYLTRFIRDCGLTHASKVLDIGCGSGRLAVPLTKYLNEQGSYDGFDIDPRGILWCTKNITAKYPNFRFCVSDIYNKEYNTFGKYSAKEYRFPYKDSSFDLVALTSVFTHMLPDDIAHYLAEIARVLKPGGKVLATYFLFNKKSGYLNTIRGTLNFAYDCDIYRTISDEIPEAAISFDEEYILGLYKDAGLSMAGPIEYGAETGRQDIILGETKVSPTSSPR